METMRHYIDNDDSKTMQEILDRMGKLRRAVRLSKFSTPGMNSAMELLLRFVTRAPSVLENAQQMATLRGVLKDRMSDVIALMERSAGAVGKKVLPALGEGGTLVTRGWSPAVVSLCSEAVRQGAPFSVCVLGQDSPGQRMVRALRAEGVEVEAVGEEWAAHLLQRPGVAVVVGCDALCDNGGAFVAFGQLNLMVVGRQFARDVIVLAEMFRFVEDAPGRLGLQLEEGERPNVEYCPKEFITKIFTEMGQLFPGYAQYVRTNILT